MKTGLKKFEIKGEAAVKLELSQMHQRSCFNILLVTELTRRKKKYTTEGLMFLSVKGSIKIKGRLSYNGKPTRYWIYIEESQVPWL